MKKKEFHQTHEPDLCPDAGLLFDYINNPGKIEPESIKRLERHFVECSFCAESIHVLKENSEKRIISDLEEDELDQLISELDLPGKSDPIFKRVHDISECYPQPNTRVFDFSKVQSWRDRIKRAGEDLIRVFNPVGFKLPELNPVSVRSAAKAKSIEEDRLVELVENAKNAMEKENFKEASEIYGSIARMLEGHLIEREVWFLAGVAMLRSGAIEKAAEHLKDSINEESRADHYWLLAHALLEKGDIEQAFKNLQVVEGFKNDLGEKARRILDEIAS